eukprot:3680735-Rhodomonas_salina.1
MKQSERKGRLRGARRNKRKGRQKGSVGESTKEQERGRKKKEKKRRWTNRRKKKVEVKVTEEGEADRSRIAGGWIPQSCKNPIVLPRKYPSASLHMDPCPRHRARHPQIATASTNSP